MGQFHESYAWQKLLFYSPGSALTLTVAKSNLPTVNGTVSPELSMTKTVVLFTWGRNFTPSLSH